MLSQKLQKRPLVCPMSGCPCASNADAHAMGWSPGSNEESIAKGSNASSVPLNPPSRLLLRQRQMGAKLLVSKDLQIQMQSPWPKDTSGEVGATALTSELLLQPPSAGAARVATLRGNAFWPKKLIAISADATTARLLFKAFLGVFQGSS